MKGAIIRGIMVTAVITSKIDIKITIKATVINRINRINGKTNKQIFNNKTDKIDSNRINKGQTILDRIVAVVVDREVLDQEAVADQEVVDQEAVDSIVINNRTAEVIGVKPIYSNTLIINEIK